MRPVLAVARLALAEGVRMRVVLVFLIILGLIVLRLPFALRGDETLSGRLQTFLSYSLSALSVFLGLAVAFLSCATLTNEFRTRSLHMVVTKPISRFQILLGKWIGVNVLSLLIVALSGLTVYGFASFIKTRPETFVRDRLKLDDTVWTARQFASPTKPDFLALATQSVEEMEKSGSPLTSDREVMIAQRFKEFEGRWLSIKPGDARQYEFKGIRSPEDAQTVFQLSFKVRGIPLPKGERMPIQWIIFDPVSGAPGAVLDTSERVGERHDMLIGSRVVQENRALIGVLNPPIPGNDSAIYFEGEQSLILLYKAGSFEMNLVRCLTLILCRMAFLSAVGLFFGTFTSFPVACFCTLSIYLFCVGVPWWLESIGANLPEQSLTAKIDPYGEFGRPIRLLLVPMLQYVLPDFIKYDGINSLIDGRYIDGGLMLTTAMHTLVYGIVLLLVPGWLVFRSREVAEVQI